MEERREDQDKKELRKKDLLLSLVLLGVSIWMWIESLKMIFVDLPGVKDVGWFVAPGVFPLILSSGLIVMSLIILWIAIRESGGIKREDWKKWGKYLVSDDFLITLLEAALLLFYIFFLLKRIRFSVATTIYLFLSMLIVRATSWYKIALISVAVSLGVTYLFGSLFKIPLP